jgi:putative Mg2+ transporter-C (MgtC) family protein
VPEGLIGELTALPQATPWAVAILRLMAACLCGGLIGLERELRAKPAGLRTHIAVAVGACLFCLLTFELMQQAVAVRGDLARTDPVRVIEAVTAGVAFLAAGTIISSGRRVSGLTTGAGLWVAGAIGVACGIGQLPLAGFATLLMLAVLALLGRLEAARAAKPPQA